MKVSPDYSSGVSKSFRISFFRRRLFPILLLIITFFLFLGMIITNIVENNIRKKLDNDNAAFLAQTKRSFESVMSEVYALTLILTYDTSSAKTIKRCLKSTHVHYSDIQNIRASIIIPLVATRAYIDSIYIYFENPNDLFIANTEGIRSLDTYYDTKWYESITASESLDKMIWSEARSFDKYGFSQQPSQVVTLYQRNLYHDGIIVLNLSQDFFNQQLNTMISYEDQRIYILDEDGTLLFSNTDNTQLSENVVNEVLSADPNHEWSKDYFMCSSEADFIPNWTFVSVVPKKALYAPIRQIRLSIFFTMIVACIFGIIIISSRIWQSYRSINRIMAFIEGIKTNPQAPGSLKKEPKEYEFIVESLIEAYARENALKQQLLENKYTEKVLELKGLQSQINPHFLLNTLQSIFWASFQLTSSYNNVSKMIEDLNTILGYLLESDNILVPIERELRNLESYISIQQIRTNFKFEMQWDVEENLSSYYTGKLLFQPFLENAIQHGFQGNGHWMLRFRIRKKNCCLLISITDNGKGISEKELLILQEKLLHTELSSNKHIGIYNCNRRLQLLFGNQYKIAVRSKEGIGTRISLCLPLITDENLPNYNK